MSRIGRKPISIPDGVKVTVGHDVITVTGPKGEIAETMLPNVKVTATEKEIVVERANDDKETRALHGLMRSLLSNHVVGVKDGFKKTLKLVGTGYRVQAKGQGVSLAVGYSHPVEFTPPTQVLIKVEGQDTINIEGINKQQVGQVAANIRKVRPPEPYKGKGIRYIDEVVKLKPGKTTM